MKVSWDDCLQYMEKQKMVQTTKQRVITEIKHQPLGYLHVGGRIFPNWIVNACYNNTRKLKPNG